MKVIIRDDDINFFTNPQQIKKIYGYCFDKNIKICFGVTPLQKINSGSLRKDIPKNLPRRKHFDILENKLLCRLLKKLALDGNEICMHGISHTKNEMELFDKNNSSEKFEQGMRILEKASGIKAKTYIPPFGYLSRKGINFLRQNSINISYSFYFHYKNLLLPFKNLYLKNIIHNEGWRIFLSDEYLFGYATGKHEKPKMRYNYAKKRFNLFYRLNKPFIIINHYWDFCDDDLMIHYWNKFIRWVVEKKDVEVTTFKGFA